eukprot:9889115-Lingulodinium_polyedra.AAC.1
MLPHTQEPPPALAPAGAPMGPTGTVPADTTVAPVGWGTALCGVCGERTEARARPLCNLCDHLRDTLCLLANF